MAEPRLFSTNARIDIATNFASFDSIDFTADFDDFLHGRLGAGHLLSLVHEATHHWCLTTPVGTALAARTFRTYHDAALIAAASRGREAYAHERKEALDRSIFVSRTLTTFFVPLLEGLALYAEWRARPAEGGTFSRPFDLLRLVAGRSEPSEKERGLSESLIRDAEGLTGSRLQDAVTAWTARDDVRTVEREGVWETMFALAGLRRRPIERKRLRSVFGTSMDPRHGSYQLGYLFVCALERICDAGGRSDMLLAFLRDHFLDDLELATLILDEGLPMETLYSEVRSRLQAKVFDLVGDPAAAAARLRDWGGRQPFALPTAEGADGFFRYGTSSGTDRERQAYRAQLHGFCRAAASPAVPAEPLEAFLLGGRVLMPVGSKEFTCRSIDADRHAFFANDGTEVTIATAQLGSSPAVGDAVTMTMLVNVASPGTAVSLRWRDGFEAVSLTDDATSKALIEQFYAGAAVIGSAVEAGQSVVGLLHRTTPDGTEPVEAFVDQYLDGGDAALDVLQIYRAPIVRAFSVGQPEVFDSRWRTEAFRTWQPRGIATILRNDAALDDLLRVCGMTVQMEIGRDALPAAGMTEAEAAAAERDLFELLNACTTDEYRAITEAMDVAFRAAGVELFGESGQGRLVSLV